MLSILTAAFGFLGGFVPEIIKLFKAKQDNKHELDILDRQMKIQELVGKQRLDEINVQADVESEKALYASAAIKQSGVKWVDAIMEFYNSSVRPTITYLFVIFYGFAKYAQYLSIRQMDPKTTSLQTIGLIYNEYDQATLTLVLSYYFGNRAASKYFNKFYK